MDIFKSKQQPSGFRFSLAEKGNTRLGEGKKEAIIDALNSTWTEGVYQTDKGELIQQLLNGSHKVLTKDFETGKYYFI